MDKYNFTRGQILDCYSLFKVLAKITALKNDFDKPIGVDFETFKRGIKELGCENEDLTERFFN